MTFVGARGSFAEPRPPANDASEAAHGTFTAVSVSEGPDLVFQAGTAGGGERMGRMRAPPKRTPRKAATPFKAKQAEINIPQPEAQPTKPFVFQAVGDGMRTPGVRKSKARTATPSTTASSVDGMAWSPVSVEEQQQKTPVAASSRSMNGGVGDEIGTPSVARDFEGRLKLDEQQEKERTAAAAAARAEHFVFGAGASGAGEGPSLSTFAFGATATQTFSFTAATNGANSLSKSARKEAGLRPRKHGKTPLKHAAGKKAEFEVPCQQPSEPAAAAPQAPPSPPPAAPFTFGQADAAPSENPPTFVNISTSNTTVSSSTTTTTFTTSFTTTTATTPGAPLRRRPRGPTKSQNPVRSTAKSIPTSAAKPSVASTCTTTGGVFSPPPLRPPMPPPQNGQIKSIVATADRSRVQGNEHFKRKNYEEAFKYYTQAINTVIPYPEAHNQLALLLSNRAAASLALSRPLQALQDCRMGLHHNPGFLKCALRMTTCHVRLGEYSEAREIIAKVKAGLKVFDAAWKEDLEQKEKELLESEGLLRDALRALGHSSVPAPEVEVANSVAAQKISLEEAIKNLEQHGAHFPHAEAFYAARAEAMLRLGRLKDAETIVAQSPHADAPETKANAPWRIWIKAQIAFHRGQTTECLKLLAEVKSIALVLQHQSTPASPSRVFSAPAHAAAAAAALKGYQSSLEGKIVRPPTAAEIDSIMAILEQSERLRGTGNEAYRNKNYSAALDAYTEAFGSGVLSPALAAVFYCNRAAAHQSLKNIALAVADCCRAKALAPGYAKAHSRLATLLGNIGMHSAAADELSAALGTSGLDAAARSDYQKRLKAAKEAATPRRNFFGGAAEAPPVDHYKLLGVERSCSTADVRKAYKKLALQLHPDKATSSCRVAFTIGSTAASELINASSEVQQRLQDNATWLFRCLGEAHDVLSSAEKRRELDSDLAAQAASSGVRGSPDGGSGSYYGRHGGFYEEFHGFGGPYGGGGASFGGYYRPHSQPSYNFNRSTYGGGAAGGSRTGHNYRHYW